MFCLVSVENCFEKSAPRRKFISSLKVWRREVVNLLAEILILFLNKEMDVFYFRRQELENFLLSNYAGRGARTFPNHCRLISVYYEFLVENFPFYLILLTCLGICKN